MRRSPPPWPNPGRPLGSSSAMKPAVVAMSRSVRRRSSCRRPSMPSFLHVSRWCDDKAGAWLVVEHTHMAPLGYCFGAAGEAIGGGSFASLLLVGTTPAMKAPMTGMLTHQGWPVRAAGLALVWVFPSRVRAMPDQPREKLLDVVTFSSLLRGWWQRWGSLARECPVAGGRGLVSPPGGCSAVSCTGGGSVLRGCPTRDLSRLPHFFFFFFRQVSRFGKLLKNSNSSFKLAHTA